MNWKQTMKKEKGKSLLDLIRSEVTQECKPCKSKEFKIDVYTHEISESSKNRIKRLHRIMRHCTSCKNVSEESAETYAYKLHSASI